MRLRPYQLKAIESIRNAIRDKKNKILLHSATGSGKTQIAKSIIQNAVDKGSKVLFITKGRLVVSNGANAIPNSSIIMNGHKKDFDINNPIQIASIDTVVSRRDSLIFLKDFNIIIYDEAHFCTSKSYQTFMDWVGVDNKIHIGLTATPYKVGKKYHTFWNAYVSPVGIKQLLEDGYLNKYTLYVPNDIDTSGVEMTADDFNIKQLAKAVNKQTITGNVVNTYKKIAKGKVGVYFAVNIQHAQNLSEQFESEGIMSSCITGNTSSKQREKYIKELKESFLLGKPYVLVSVGVLTVGVDIPEIEVCGIVRPTHSEILHIQIIGRALRITPGKDENVIIIDHAGNCLKHGLPCIKREPDLNPKKVKAVTDIAIKSCSKCFIVYEPKLKACPNCGFQELIKKRDSTINHQDGELVQYSEEQNKLLAVVDYNKAVNYFEINLRGRISQAKYMNDLYKRLYKKYNDAMLELAPNSFKEYIRKEKIINSIKEY